MRTDLAPKCQAPYVKVVKMMSMHGQISTYPRKIYQVKVLNVTWEMSMGFLGDLPYQMVLDQDWDEIYQVLDVVRAQAEDQIGMIGVEAKNTITLEGLDLKSFTSNLHFREPQQREDAFQAIIQI